MRTVIVGAGPTGLYTAIALARRGHDVVVIDNRIVSALIARASADRQLAALRAEAAFDAATRAIPALAAWTDPRRARPITRCCPAGGCTTATGDSSTAPARSRWTG
jgi:2-polyprenyl-6-methoxyphenol hydroxylase-like FAD-dependent oxidoreductase